MPLLYICTYARYFRKRYTFTGSSVAEKASWSAQQANRHISSVNTGPTVTKTYLRKRPTNHVNSSQKYYLLITIITIIIFYKFSRIKMHPGALINS